MYCARTCLENVRHPVNLLAQDRPNNEFALQLFCQYSRTRLAFQFDLAPTLPGDGSASASQGTRSLDCCHTCISDVRSTKVVDQLVWYIFPDLYFINYNVCALYLQCLLLYYQSATILFCLCNCWVIYVVQMLPTSPMPQVGITAGFHCLLTFGSFLFPQNQLPSAECDSLQDKLLSPKPMLLRVPIMQFTLLP